MAKPLTVQLIQLKTKTDQMSSIKNLNLWGNDLDDLKALRQLPNLEVLSLSVNRISTLKEIAACMKLKELYLRKNEIDDINELKYVQHLPNLKVLWLQGTTFIAFRQITPALRSRTTDSSWFATFPTSRSLITRTSQSRTGFSQLGYTCLNTKQAATRRSRQPAYQEPIQRPSSVYRDPYQSAKEEDHQVLRGSQIHFQHHQPPPPSLHPQFQQSYHEPEEVYDDKAGVTTSDRNENILCAVLALVKELDENSLRVVLGDIERKLGFLKHSRKN